MISTSPSLPHFIFPYSHRHFTVLHTVLHYSRSFFFMCPLFRIPFPLLWTYCSSLAAVVFASFPSFFTHWIPFSYSPSFLFLSYIVKDQIISLSFVPILFFYSFYYFTPSPFSFVLYISIHILYSYLYYLKILV